MKAFCDSSSFVSRETVSKLYLSVNGSPLCRTSSSFRWAPVTNPLLSAIRYRSAAPSFLIIVQAENALADQGELGTEHESEKRDKLWPDWGTTATWKRDSKDKKVVAPAGGELDDGPRKVKAISELKISTASPYAEQVENSTLWALKQNEDVETRVSNGHSDFQAESEQPVKIENGICSVRAKHLLEGDKWKTCRQCRAVLRQVAIQLASTGHADENEYEMMDHILTE